MSIDLMIGDRVRLKSHPPYLKTAGTMPMLRPGDLIPVCSQGLVTEQKPRGNWTVKIERGTFLVDSLYLEKVTGETAGTTAAP